LITPITQELEESEVPQNLKLLPDFWSDVLIIRVENRKFIRILVHVSQVEFREADPFDNPEHIDKPPAADWCEPLEPHHSRKLVAYGRRRNRLTVCDEGNLPTRRNFMEKYIATDPACPASSRCQRFSPLNCTLSQEEGGD
jgi:hypothetical protein